MGKKADKPAMPPLHLLPRFKAALPALCLKLKLAEAAWKECGEIGRGKLDPSISKECREAADSARWDVVYCRKVIDGLANPGCLHWDDDHAPCSCPGGKHLDQRKRG